MPSRHFSKGCWLFLLLLLQLSLFAQNKQSSRLYQLVRPAQEKLLQRGNMPAVSLFQVSSLQSLKRNIPDTLLSKKTILSLNKNIQSTLLRNTSNVVKLAIPTVEKNFDLVLMKQDMNPKNKSLLPLLQVKSGKSAHYRGYIDGDPNSLAALSVFEDGSVVGLFINKTGNYVLTKLKGSDEYIIYNDMDLKIKQPFICGTKDETIAPSAPGKIAGTSVPSVTGFAEMQCRKVRCYWEADYKTYQNFNSDYTATENYVLALFNQVAAVYQNEGITIELSAYKIWTTSDPYRDDNTSVSLVDFQNTWNAQDANYDGDLAYLICGRYDAGYAFVNGLCNRKYAYGVYGMNLTTIYPWQTYSWDVQATAHEHGHLLGSNHTQWCGWNTAPGNTCGAIDNCFPGEATNTCSTCSFSTFNDADPVDAWRGTIMSYCHLKARGILMINGFGPLPGDLIRKNVTESQCLQTIGVCPEVCLAPTGLSTSGTSYPDYSEVTCTWAVVPDVNYYNFEYKKVSDVDWAVITAVPTNQYKLFVEGGTNYLFRVKTYCANSSSEYSAEYLFRAPCVPPSLSVSDITSTSALISWAGYSGAKTFTLEYKKASDNVWTVIDGIVDASQSLSALDANTAYNYRMKKICPDEESGYGVTGTFTTSCAPPTSLSESIFANTIFVSWVAAPGNPSYVFEYRKTTETGWTVINTANKATSQGISGLEAGEEYVYRIKSKCSEEFYSDYTPEKTFAIDCSRPSSAVAYPQEDNALIIWAGSGARSFDFQYRKSGDNNWNSNIVTDARINLTNLRKGTDYEYGIFSQCRLVKSTTSLLGTFRTLGEPLPLGLTDFEGAHIGDDNILHWSTHDEVNTNKFEIEYSADNTSYQLAGTVAAAGSSSSSLQYNFTHKNISADAYYRLKMIDIDGSFTYSNTIFIKGNNDQKECVLLNDAVYPIPFEDKFTMNIYSCALQTAKIILRSIDGKLLKNETVTLKKGTASYELNNLGSLSAGSYSLQIIPQKGDVIARKVVKR